ncbi:hypothetical protein [Tortoise microvirus 107]|nr:hypothetical protein [Tortoise microvirus 107]
MTTSVKSKSDFVDKMMFCLPRTSVGWRAPPAVIYDDIVDDSDFKRVQDENRIARLTHDTGSSTAGVYDFDESRTNFDSVTTIQLAIRSGKLDPADIDTLKRELEGVAKREAESIAAKQEATRDLQALKARNRAIDKVLDISRDESST